MAGHAQQLGQMDGQEAQKGEGPGLGPWAGSWQPGEEKEEELYQLRGAGASPTASSLECPHLPALKREQKLAGGQGLVFAWSSKMTLDSHRTLSWSQTSKPLLSKSPYGQLSSNPFRRSSFCYLPPTYQGGPYNTSNN